MLGIDLDITVDSLKEAIPFSILISLVILLVSPFYMTALGYMAGVICLCIYVCMCVCVCVCVCARASFCLSVCTCTNFRGRTGGGVIPQVRFNWSRHNACRRFMFSSCHIFHAPHVFLLIFGSRTCGPNFSAGSTLVTLHGQTQVLCAEAQTIDLCASFALTIVKTC